MNSVFQALAVPRRIEILRLVRNREMAAGEIAKQFDVTRPAISQHLRILAEAGLIAERREGTKRMYRLRPEGLEQLGDFLREFWGDRLGDLKTEVERKHESGQKSKRSH